MYLNKNPILTASMLGIYSFCALLMSVLCAVIYADGGFHGNTVAVPIIVMIALSAVITGIIAVRLASKVYTACKMNTYFEADADGIVPVADLAEFFHKDGDKFQKKVAKMADRGFFVRLNYNKKDNVFYLSDRIKPMRDIDAADNNSGRAADNSFVGLHCPGCGTTLKVRMNVKSTCPSCGREIFVPKVKTS